MKQGFTLIELLIAIVIVAILAAIALPIYEHQIQESRRASAKSSLLDVAAAEEKYFSTNNTYTNSLANPGYAATANNTLDIPSATEDYYQIQISTASNTSFTATATPVNAQATDDCGEYVVNAMGNQSVQAIATTPTPMPGNCW